MPFCIVGLLKEADYAEADARRMMRTDVPDEKKPWVESATHGSPCISLTQERVARRRPIKPRKARPMANNAHCSGSGTAVTESASLVMLAMEKI